MLEIDTEVEKGILFVKLNGYLNNNNFNILGNKINYLLYRQGISNFVFDFTNIKYLEDGIFSKIQNKLIEIFLSCGKVALCGMSDIVKEKIGFTKDKLYYIESNLDAFKYLSL